MQEQQNTKERDLRLDWKRWLNYRSIVKQMPFFLFLAVLAVLYIYNGHYADKTVRNINKTAKEKHEYLARAVEYRYGKLVEACQQEDSVANRLYLSSFSKMREAGCFEGDEISKLKILAKQIILFETVLNS